MSYREKIESKLEKISDAIDAVLNEQSYSIDGVSYTRANLDSLLRMEERYENKLARIDKPCVSRFRAPREG